MVKSYFYSKGNRTLLNSCEVNNVELLNEDEEVIIITNNSSRINNFVERIDYYRNCTIKYIPNSIFVTYPRLSYFRIHENSGFKELKPHYFKNANNLTFVRIEKNLIATLRDRIFMEAKKLEYIDLESNQITSIHEHAFYGLPKLRGLHLSKNKIFVLSSITFSQLTNLLELDLSKNVCVDENFKETNKNFSRLELTISKECTQKTGKDISKLINYFCVAVEMVLLLLSFTGIYFLIHFVTQITNLNRI